MRVDCRSCHRRACSEVDVSGIRPGVSSFGQVSWPVVLHTFFKSLSLAELCSTPSSNPIALESAIASSYRFFASS